MSGVVGLSPGSAEREHAWKITLRPARLDDVAALEVLAQAAITELQQPYLDRRQVEASKAIMGIDTQLVEDGTYAVAERDGWIVGCGGWSRRRTMYGGDNTPGRDDDLLDPSSDAARVRAMYTRPEAARRGIGRRILVWCEAAARREGFRRLELVATMAGAPLYLAAGFEIDGPFEDTSTGVAIPLLRMSKPIEPT